MEIKPKSGIDQLLFGMKRADVEAICGKPSGEFKDDDNNIIWVYNNLKMRLTFYQDEDFRLGYIICANPKLTLFSQVVIGQEPEVVKSALKSHKFQSWEVEDFDITENHFNEDNWTILQSEFGEIIKVEIGAIINSKDEFDWKFPSKK